MSHSVSLTQKEELADVFDLYDRAGNGAITTTDLIQVLRYFGYYPDDNEFKRLVAEMDGDGSGLIEFAEFTEFIGRLRRGQKHSDEALWEAFQMFDPDNTGFVEASEMKRVLGYLVEDPQEVEDMVEAADDDHDGQINYRDFVRRMHDP